MAQNERNANASFLPKRQRYFTLFTAIRLFITLWISLFSALKLQLLEMLVSLSAFVLIYVAFGELFDACINSGSQSHLMK